MRIQSSWPGIAGFSLLAQKRPGFLSSVKTWIFELIKDQSEAENANETVTFCEALCLFGSMLKTGSIFAKKNQDEEWEASQWKSQSIPTPSNGQEKGDEGARWLRKGMQNGLGPAFPPNSLSLSFLLRFFRGGSFPVELGGKCRFVWLMTNSRDFDL